MVSICIATHNSHNTIRRTLSSIKNQLYEDFEVVIVDDNSEDDTCSIIENEFCNVDGRFKLFKDIADKEHPFVSAHNLSYELASGDYLFRVDHDDILFSDYILKHIKFMDENPNIDACSSRLYMMFLGENDTIPDDINFISEYSFPRYEEMMKIFNRCPAYYFIYWTTDPKNKTDWCVWHNNSSCIRKTFYDKYHPVFTYQEIADVMFWRQVLSYGARLYCMPDHLSVGCIVNSTSTYQRNPVYNKDVSGMIELQYYGAKYAYESFLYYNDNVLFDIQENLKAQDMKEIYLNTLNIFKEELIKNGQWENIPEEQKHLNINHGYKDI